MRLRSLTNVELRDRTLALAARLRRFQAGADGDRKVMLDRTLPGWTVEARAIGFRQTTLTLKEHHDKTQSTFKLSFRSQTLALQRELMARLGIPVRHDGEELAPLQYDAADYLEELARKLAV